MPSQALSTPSPYAADYFRIGLPRTCDSSIDCIKRLDGVYGRIQGWILSLFDSALRIYDEKTCKYFYLRTRDIVRHLCAIPNTGVAQIIPSTSKKITHLVLENLNPLTGVTPTAEKVSHFFREFRTPTFIQQLMATNESEETSALAVKRLEDFKNRHLTIIPFDDVAITHHLKPGDIFFRKIPENETNLVVTGQRLFAPFLRNKERQGHTFSHVGIYIGNGKIAEAVPAEHGSDVRIISIHHPEFILSSKYQYLISRFKDEDLALSAAVIAAWIAKDDTYSDPHFEAVKYNKFEAGSSLCHPSNFGFFGRYRYLKQFIDDRVRDIPANILGRKNFFCSYFAGYCYQVAESRTLIPSLLGKCNIPSQENTWLNRPFFRELWARIRRCQFWNKMSKEIAFQFDAKRTSPHKLRNFMLQRPDLFRDLYLIKAPS